MKLSILSRIGISISIWAIALSTLLGQEKRTHKKLSKILEKLFGTSNEKSNEEASTYCLFEFEQLQDLQKHITKLDIVKTESTRGHSRTSYYANLTLDQNPISIKIITANGPTLFSDADQDEDKKFQSFLFAIKLKQLLK